MSQAFDEGLLNEKERPQSDGRLVKNLTSTIVHLLLGLIELNLFAWHHDEVFAANQDHPRRRMPVRCNGVPDLLKPSKFCQLRHGLLNDVDSVLQNGSQTMYHSALFASIHTVHTLKPTFFTSSSFSLSHFAPCCSFTRRSSAKTRPKSSLTFWRVRESPLKSATCRQRQVRAKRATQVRAPWTQWMGKEERIESLSIRKVYMLSN